MDFVLANSWLEYRDNEILNGNRKLHNFLSFRNEVADVLLKAKLDSPSVEAAIPVEWLRLCAANYDESKNLQRDNRPSAKRLHPNLMYDLISFAIFQLQLMLSANSVR